MGSTRLDPRSLVPDGNRRDLEEDAGFAALFAWLQQSGPATVPSRWKAARLAERSVTTFKRDFPRLAGATWRGFVTIWRLECGRKWLESRSRSVKEVAHACGYRSAKSFARAYRRRFGVPPKSGLGH